MKSQCLTILEHLSKASITQAEALSRYGVARLASRVNDLKNDGHKIESVLVDVVNRHGQRTKVARYSLVARA